jgi:hypothetical protein
MNRLIIIAITIVSLSCSLACEVPLAPDWEELRLLCRELQAKQVNGGCLSAVSDASCDRFGREADRGPAEPTYGSLLPPEAREQYLCKIDIVNCPDGQQVPTFVEVCGPDGGTAVVLD